jgi:hypothetical protein
MASIEFGEHNTDRADGIVISSDGISDFFRIAVCINNGNDRNSKPVGFGHGDFLSNCVDDNHDIREFGHFGDTAKIVQELGPSRRIDEASALLILAKAGDSEELGFPSSERHCGEWS